LLPKFQILQDITDLADKLKSKQLELAQKQLLLETTKTNLQIQLQQDEIDIKQKVIVVKKRENISALVEKLRQQEVDLQGKIFARISKNKEFQKLQNSQQKIVSDNITNNLLKTDPKRGN
jgi:hypothetical protein